MEKNILQIDNRKDFREWLKLHADSENECWVELKRGRPVDDDKFYYIDAVAKEKEQPVDGAEQGACPPSGKAWVDDRCGQSCFAADGTKKF